MADADTLTLTLSTGGDVVIKLRPDLAPGHVERIASLARDGFYDGVVFHRVIPGFMAQGGDPTGRGTGGSDLPRLHLVDQRLADVLVQLGIDVGVDDVGERSDQAFAFVAGGKLDQIGDVSRVQRLDQLARGFVVARVDGVEDALDEVRPQPVLLVHDGGVRLGRGGGGDRLALAHGCSPDWSTRNGTRAPSYGRAGSGARRAGRLKRGDLFHGDEPWPTPTP